MGLRATFNPEDMGYKKELNDDEFGITVDIEYDNACQAFVDAFLDTARTLVPVDTGYLKSTLEANTDGWECTANTNCEYAQFVEYGTFKMKEQPYFIPALEEGIRAFRIEAQQANNDANTELQELIQEESEKRATESAMTQTGGGFGGLKEAAVAAVIFAILYPILVQVYAVYKTITDPLKNVGKDGVKGVSRANFIPEIEIY